MYTFSKSIHSVNPATSVIVRSAGNLMEQHPKQTPIVTKYIYY